MSQERMENSESRSSTGSSNSMQAPDIDSTLSAASKVVNKVRVVHGANEQYFDNLGGQTVGKVRKSLREVFNIPGDAEALIAGKQVGDDYILEGGQSLEFLKNSGIKGAAS